MRLSHRRRTTLAAQLDRPHLLERFTICTALSTRRARRDRRDDSTVPAAGLERDRLTGPCRSCRASTRWGRRVLLLRQHATREARRGAVLAQLLFAAAARRSAVVVNQPYGKSNRGPRPSSPCQPYGKSNQGRFAAGPDAFLTRPRRGPTIVAGRRAPGATPPRSGRSSLHSTCTPTSTRGGRPASERALAPPPPGNAYGYDELAALALALDLPRPSEGRRVVVDGARRVHASPLTD